MASVVNREGQLVSPGPTGERLPNSNELEVASPTGAAGTTKAEEQQDRAGHGWTGVLQGPHMETSAAFILEISMDVWSISHRAVLSQMPVLLRMRRGQWQQTADTKSHQYTVSQAVSSGWRGRASFYAKMSMSVLWSEMWADT